MTKLSLLAALVLLVGCASGPRRSAEQVVAMVCPAQHTVSCDRSGNDRRLSTANCSCLPTRELNLFLIRR